MLQEGYTQAAIAKVFDQRAQAINAYVRRFNLTPNRDLADVDVEKLRQRFSIDIEIYK